MYVIMYVKGNFLFFIHIQYDYQSKFNVQK